MTVIRFRLSIGPDEMWTDDAIAGLVGQTTNMKAPGIGPTKATVVSAERKGNGVEVGLRVSPEVVEMVRTEPRYSMESNAG